LGGRFPDGALRVSQTLPEVQGFHGLHPSDPPLPILPTALRTLRAGWNHKVPPALAHKAGLHVNEIIQGLLGDGKTFRAEVIAQKIESSLGPAHQGLMQHNYINLDF